MTGIDRRNVLKLAAGAGVSAAGARLGGRIAWAAPRRRPVVFVSHGTPMTVMAKDDYAKALRQLGVSLGKPRAILIASAHFMKAKPTLLMTADVMPKVLHDFEGYPPALSTLIYPCKGSTKIAEELSNELWTQRLQAIRDGMRGLDHGAWIPLRHMYPKADVPVIEVSIPPNLSPLELVRFGALFSTLRSRDVVLVGSGGAVKNLATLQPEGSPPLPWAKAFDDWLADKLAKRADDELYAWKQNAPNAEMAHPTPDHLAPLFMMLGATERKEKVRTVYAGIKQGSLSLRTFTIG